MNEYVVIALGSAKLFIREITDPGQKKKIIEALATELKTSWEVEVQDRFQSYGPRLPDRGPYFAHTLSTGHLVAYRAANQDDYRRQDERIRRAVDRNMPIFFLLDVLPITFEGG